MRLRHLELAPSGTFSRLGLMCTQAWQEQSLEFLGPFSSPAFLPQDSLCDFELKATSLCLGFSPAIIKA